MKKLHTYIGHYWYGYLFAICSMIIATGLDMVYPQITQRIVDEVIIGGKMEMLTGLLVGIVAVGIGAPKNGHTYEIYQIFTGDYDALQPSMLTNIKPAMRAQPL